MRLGAATLTVLFLLASYRQVDAAVPRLPKNEGADQPAKENQPSPSAAAAPPSKPGHSMNNRTQGNSATDASNSPRTKKNDAAWKYDTADRSEEYRKFSGVRYTPLDLAEYILRTHDEEGVALAIEELLKEGLINREEAILYLESVKKELQTLKKRFENEVTPQNTKSTSTPNRIPQIKMQPNAVYESHRKAVQAEEKRSQQQQQQVPPHVAAFHKQLQTRLMPERHQEQHVQVANTAAAVSDQLPTDGQQQLPLQLARLVKAKAEQEKEEQPNRTTLKSALNSKNNNNNSRAQTISGEQHKQQPAYDDYLMENVIYQLAKDMFTQSMIRDNASAEQLLSRFASFLENELADKRFSKETQNKIMDTVSAALVESLRERLYLEN